MKHSLTICAVIVFVLAIGGLLVCDFAKAVDSDGCTTLQDGVLVDSAGNLLTTGYDAWGYNYQAHLFNGLYWNNSRPAVPWTEETLIAAGKSTTWLTMKWNDAWLSNKDCDGDGLLDRHLGHDSYRGSGAWCTNHQSGSYEVEVKEKTKVAHWTYFVKIASAPTDAYTAENDDGVLMYYGADDVEIGSVIWTHHARIQQVENDPFSGIHGKQYLSPTSPGFGYYSDE